MRHLLEKDLKIGMLENSGAERQHQIGKIQFKKALYGGGTLLKGMTLCENRSACLTFRGLLIWQYGRDIIATENALRKLEPTFKRLNRGRNEDCWKPIRVFTHPILNLSAPENENKMKVLMNKWKSRDDNNTLLEIDTLLTEPIIARIEDPNDETIMIELSLMLDGEMSEKVALGDEDGPIIFEDGEFHDSAQGKRYDDDSSESDDEFSEDSDDNDPFNDGDDDSGHGNINDDNDDINDADHNDDYG